MLNIFKSPFFWGILILLLIGVVLFANANDPDKNTLKDPDGELPDSNYDPKKSTPGVTLPYSKGEYLYVKNDTIKIQNFCKMWSGSPKSGNYVPMLANEPLGAFMGVVQKYKDPKAGELIYIQVSGSNVPLGYYWVLLDYTTTKQHPGISQWDTYNTLVNDQNLLSWWSSNDNVIIETAVTTCKSWLEGIRVKMVWKSGKDKTFDEFLSNALNQSEIQEFNSKLLNNC